MGEEVRELYTFADGFVTGAHILCDDYRLLPLDEMVEASLALEGEPVVLDALAGEISRAKRVIRLVVAQAKEDDPDIVQVSMRLWPKKRPSMETWYRAGGIHDFEEVVETQESLTAWLEGCKARAFVSVLCWDSISPILCENATMPGHTPPPHAHLWPDTATVDAAGHLLLAGIDAAALAREFGTPLYVYDEATIRAQCQLFRAAFAARWPASAVAYAGKAYLSPALCRIVLEERMELDAVSLGELGIARAAQFPSGHIHLHGNFKPDAELAAALDLGIGRIVVDSLDELARVEALARERGKPAAIWLRLCPDVPTQTHAYTQTGQADSKFGLDTASGAARAAAVRAHESPWLDLVGLHAHAGSHLFDVTPAARVVAFLGAFAADLRETTGTQVRELSPGGGLGVAYLPADQAPAIADYADVVTRALAETVRRHRLEPPRVVVEPGRAIVARAGVALYTTGPRKAVPGGTTFLAVDGGMGDNPRPALYGAGYWAALAERMTAPPDETVCIVGRYCESGDVLVERIALPHAQPGDVLAMPVSGAYQLPMASNYNLIARPAVVFVRDGQAHLVRRREALDDLLRLEVAD